MIPELVLAGVGLIGVGIGVPVLGFSILGDDIPAWMEEGGVFVTVLLCVIGMLSILIAVILGFGS